MDELDENRKHIKQAFHSPGGKLILKYIDDEIVTGWEKFIALPVEKKTSKAAYDAQAKYKVLKEFKDWLISESGMV